MVYYTITVGIHACPKCRHTRHLCEIVRNNIQLSELCPKKSIVDHITLRYYKLLTAMMKKEFLTQ